MQPVKIMRRSGQGVLVEWVEEGEIYRRAIVPAGSVIQDASDAYCSHPELGIPYGDAFEDYIEVNVTPAALANALRRNGIWTLADLQKRPQDALYAFRSVIGAELNALRAAAKAKAREE